jgi:uncharacterized protein YgiM (DUF1202 family)
MPKSNLLLTLILLLSITACKSDQSSSPEVTNPSTSTAPAAAPNEADEPATPSAAGIRYTWVDQLNVRDQPTTKGKVVARVKPNEPLTLTGEVMPTAETIVLRGVAYHEPWYRITTADKKDGWVFGGAVKEKEDMKGNAAISDAEFDFPAFGFFQLKDWTLLTETNKGEGDAEIKTQVYRSTSNQVLEIQATEVGEYGYSNTYRLKDAEGNLLKKREFGFTVDPNTITEEVVDYTDIPAKRYTRSQELDKHFTQLNDRPLMAQGAWKIERID